MKALGPTIIFEPIWPDVSAGGLFLGSSNRYPSSGWAVSIGTGCKEDVQPGDFIVVDDHGMEGIDAMVDTFMLRLAGYDGDEIVRCDIDAEPALKEQYEKYLANPATFNPEFQVKDIETNENVRFRASDIIDVFSGVTQEYGTTLSYRHVTKLPGTDLFVVAEREILFRIPGMLL